jgi:F-type H+-transporting ATPase subunit epsilon
MLHLDIITPDETVFEGECDAVTLPTADGEITVLPHHVPLMSTLVPGTVIVRKDKEEFIFAVTRGVIEIDGRSARILAETADRAEGLQEAAIEKAKADAQKLLSERREDTEGFAEATALLERELAKLHTIRRHHARRGGLPRQSQQ